MSTSTKEVNMEKFHFPCSVIYTASKANLHATVFKLLINEQVNFQYFPGLVLSQLREKKFYHEHIPMIFLMC